MDECVTGAKYDMIFIRTAAKNQYDCFNICICMIDGPGFMTLCGCVCLWSADQFGFVMMNVVVMKS